MKTNWLVLFVFTSGLFLVGCSPKEPAPDENVAALYERLHGKYQPIRSTSSEAIDVNLDGKVSADMMAEVPQLSKEFGNNLEIRIYGASTRSPTPGFLFTQWWPEQYVYSNNETWEGGPIAYQPGTRVSYSMQGSPRRFSFSSDLTKITVQPKRE